MTREEEIKARLEKASKGPWYAMNTDDSSCMNLDFIVNKPMPDGGLIEDFDPKDIIAITLLQAPRYASSDRFEENQDFIVNAPMDLDYLLARNEELQRRVEKLESVYESAGKMVGLFLYRKKNDDINLLEKTHADVLKVREAFDAFDAKEQDDD